MNRTMGATKMQMQRTACGDQGKINLTVAGDQQTYTNCLQKREPPQDLLINLVPSNSAVTVAG